MKQTMFGLRAETSIHAGTGQNNGVIDLPIQREKHTAYPCIFGSSVKGAFSAHAETRAGWDKHTKVQEVFGRKDAEASSNVSMSDAFLLLLPVRSLTGHFKLVTCPDILKKLKSNMQRVSVQDDFEIMNPDSQQVISHQGGHALFLEEFQFCQKQENLSGLIATLERFGVEEITEQLLVMNNNDFAWYAKNATAITPHIAIEDKEKKIAKGGALWYEETLPPDTLFYTMLMGEKADEVVKMFSEDKPFIQIGANETVGMGWCRVTNVRDQA